MKANYPVSSPDFKIVANGLIALHQLCKCNKDDDSPEAELIRDDLDAPWEALNRVEAERAQWLSQDLYSISEPATTSNEMNPGVQQQLNAVIEARQSGDLDRALTLLRQCSEYVSPALLSYLRGSIWLESGNPDIAAVFYEHALEIDPTNANYQAIYMRTWLAARRAPMEQPL